MLSEQDRLDYEARYEYCMNNYKTGADIGKHNRFRLDENNRANYWLDQANLAADVLNGVAEPVK